MPTAAQAKRLKLQRAREAKTQRERERRERKRRAAETEQSPDTPVVDAVMEGLVGRQERRGAVSDIEFRSGDSGDNDDSAAEGYEEEQQDDAGFYAAFHAWLARFPALGTWPNDGLVPGEVAMSRIRAGPVGRQLRAARKASGLTLVTLSEMSGILPANIRNLETVFEPPVNDPRLVALVTAIAKAARTSYSDVFSLVTDGGYVAPPDIIAAIGKTRGHGGLRGKKRASYTKRPYTKRADRILSMSPSAVEKRASRDRLVAPAAKKRKAHTNGHVSLRDALGIVLRTFNVERMKAGQIFVQLPLDQLYPVLAHYLELTKLGKDLLIGANFTGRVDG